MLRTGTQNKVTMQDRPNHKGMWNILLNPFGSTVQFQPFPTLRTHSENKGKTWLPIDEGGG